MPRGKVAVIGAAHHHRYRIEHESAYEFLRKVIGAPRILERQIEFVIGTDHLVARAATGTRDVTAPAVHIDRHELLQLADVLLATDRCRTMTDNPSCQFRFAFDNGDK